MYSLKNRTALITGATGHIGKVFAKTLAAHGANIAVVDIASQECEHIAESLEKDFNIKAVPFSCDLSDDLATHNLPKLVAETLGGIDILINNAGFVGTSHLKGWVTDFEEQSTETWRQACEVNMTAPFTLCREATPYLKQSKKGSIINIASIYAVLGANLSLYEGTSMGNPIAYAASKGALVQMTRWLSTVLAPDIRVNCISPGGIWRNQPEAFVKRFVEKTPMKRMGTEEDLAGTILYLASDMSLYVTGQNILVDGGWSAW